MTTTLGGLRRPRYEDACVCNIPGTIARSFGCKQPKGLGILPGAMHGGLMGQRRVKILFIIDAMGEDAWRRACGELDLARRISNASTKTGLDSVFPSSTPLALPAILTGSTPYQGGTVEYLQYDPALGRVIKPILFAKEGGEINSLASVPGASIGRYFSQPPLTRLLASEGVRCFSLVPGAYVGGEFNTYLSEGSKQVGYLSTGDIPELVAASVASANKDVFLTVYLPDVDATGHKHGPNSPECMAAMAEACDTVTATVRALGSKTARETVLMIVADHGMSELNFDTVAYLDDDADLMDCLLARPDGSPLPVLGGPDNLSIFFKEGMEAEGTAHLKRVLLDKAEVLSTQCALEGGWFGKGTVSKAFVQCLGDVQILMNPGHHAWIRKPDRPRPLKGIHGGLSWESMAVRLSILAPERLL